MKETPKADKAIKLNKANKATKATKSTKAAKPQKAKKPKKEKYDDTEVKAKTDINQPSVKIIIKDDKKKKAEKEPKIKQKRFKKPKASKAKNQIPDLQEVKLKQEQNSALQQEGDAFSASTQPAMEGAVSATRIVSVDDCVKIALENNPTILSQLISKDIYKNKIAQAWSNYFPKLNAGISYSKNDMLMTNFKFPMQEYSLWNLPNVGFNQLIYDFGKTGAQAGVAKKTYEASRETLQSSINDVVYQVKNAYFNQLFLQQQAEVYEDSVCNIKFT